jgi:hypothetical protein
LTVAVRVGNLSGAAKAGNRKSEMADWTGQLIIAQRQAAEIEKKIAERQQAVEQLRLEGADTSQSTRLIAVLQRSLARTQFHVTFIERKIAAQAGDADRRKARAALIDSLITKHQSPPALHWRSPVVTSAPSQRLPSSTVNRLGSR